MEVNERNKLASAIARSTFMISDTGMRPPLRAVELVLDRHSRQIRCKARSNTRALCGRVYRDKDEIGLDDCLVDLCAEEQVDTTLLLYNLL